MASKKAVEHTADKEENRGRKPVPIDYDKLTEYASQRIDNKVIADMLDISETTFYVKMANDPEFRNAYEAGINNRKYNLEKALLKRAEGYDAEETETIKDSEGNVIKTKIVNKSYVPDTTALIFSLKNLYGDKYKDIIQNKTDINININQMQSLTDEELIKLSSNAVVEAVDYQIE